MRFGVRATGLAAFSLRILSLFAGMLFLMMLTRRLGPEEFAAYQLLRTGATFAAIFGDSVSFWATRCVARNKLTWYTFLGLPLLFSPISFIIIYLASSFVYGWDPSILMLVFVFSLVLLIRGGILGSIYALEPINIVKGGVAYEIMRVLMTYIFVVEMKQGVPGVFLSLTIAFVVEIAVASIKSLPTATVIDVRLAKETVKNLWMPLITRISTIIALLDVYVVSYALGSILLSGYYRILFTLITILSYTSALGMALYPSLIKEEAGKEEIRQVWKSAVVMAAPLCFGLSICMSHLLFLLNPKYVWLAPFGSISAIAGFLYALNILSDRLLLGIEKVDVERPIIKGYLSTRLKIYLLQNVTYIAILYMIFKGFKLNEFYGLLIWLTMYMLANAIGFGVKAYILREKGEWPLKVGDLKFIVVSSIVGGIVLYFFSTWLRPSVQAVVQALNLLVLAAVGGGVYFSILLALDREVRGWLLSIKRKFF